MLEVRNLALGYPQQPLATDIQAQLPPSQLTLLLGRNGCGKSTLLRTIAGLQPPVDGELWWGDVRFDLLPREARARHVALVMTQQPAPRHLTVAELVALGRTPHTNIFGRLTDHDQQIVAQALADCQLSALSHRPLATLSDGERQRAMIARALAQDTPLLLLDEPTAFLDFPAKVEMIAWLAQMAHQRQKSVLLSTHDLEVALQLADHIWLLSRANLIAGSPQALASDGTLAAHFASTTLRFDAEAMRFVPNSEFPSPAFSL